MRDISNILFVLSLAGHTFAQTTASSSARAAATHTIAVGNGDHKFRPEVTQAEIGDIIEFQFFPPNHSVVRAEYEYPCIPYEMTGKGKTGFFSGFKPVDAILPDPPKWTLRINDSSPLFFYCSAAGSCTNWGMVGVINPNSSVFLNHQRELALSAAYSLNPGESFPSESGPDPPNPSSPANRNPNDNDPTLPMPPSSRDDDKHILSAGGIAGIVIGSVSAAALLALLCFFALRHRRLKDEIRMKDSTVRRTTPPSPSAMLSAPYVQGNPNIGGGGGGAGMSIVDAGPVPPAYYQHQTQHQQYPAGSGIGMGMAPASQIYSPPMSTTGTISPRPMSPQSQYTATDGGGIDRSVSTRSVGGTFDLSPTTGYYTRTHHGEDRYKYSAPAGADITSPNAGTGQYPEEKRSDVPLGTPSQPAEMEGGGLLYPEKM